MGWPRRNFVEILVCTKLEWMGYRVVKKAWQYFQPFLYNTSVWRTDRQTDVQTVGRTDGRTNGRTDVQAIAITCFSIADARKKWKVYREWLGPAKLRDSIQIRIARFRFNSKVSGWFEIFELAASAVVPQITLTVQQKTSTVAPL